MSIKSTQEIQDLSAAFMAGMMNSEPPALYLSEAGQKIKTVKEIRAEWMMKRRGKFTASEIHRLMANGKTAGELSAGAKTYCMEKAVELLTEFDPDEDGYISSEMQWGMDHEHDAVDAFMDITGLNVKNHGREQVFIELGPDAGGTPDGVYDGGGIEIKCAKSITHMQYFGVIDSFDLKQVNPAYYWQIQMLMLATGNGQWHFVSYDPRFKEHDLRLHMALIEASQTDIDSLVKRIGIAIEYRDSIIRRALA